jgi:thymidylate synthase
MENADEMLRRASELEAAEKASGEAPAAPQLVLHKEPGCDFADITLEDFEMLDYEPLKPQLKFELGI